MSAKEVILQAIRSNWIKDDTSPVNETGAILAALDAAGLSIVRKVPAEELPKAEWTEMKEPSCIISGPIRIKEKGPIQISASLGPSGWGVALEIGKTSLVMDANEALHLSTALRKAAEEAVLGGASCQSSEHAVLETTPKGEQ